MELQLNFLGGTDIGAHERLAMPSIKNMAYFMRVQNNYHRQQLQGPACLQQQPPDTHELACFFDKRAALRSTSASTTAVLQR